MKNSKLESMFKEKKEPPDFMLLSPTIYKNSHQGGGKSQQSSSKLLAVIRKASSSLYSLSCLLWFRTWLVNTLSFYLLYSASQQGCSLKG